MQLTENDTFEGEPYRSPSFDPYAAAPTVLVCPSCGEALLPGDTYIRLRGDGEIIACEYCADVVRAQAP